MTTIPTVRDAADIGHQMLRTAMHLPPMPPAVAQRCHEHDVHDPRIHLHDRGTDRLLRDIEHVHEPEPFDDMTGPMDEPPGGISRIARMSAAMRRSQPIVRPDRGDIDQIDAQHGVVCRGDERKPHDEDLMQPTTVLPNDDLHGLPPGEYLVCDRCCRWLAVVKAERPGAAGSD